MGLERIETAEDLHLNISFTRFDRNTLAGLWGSFRPSTNSLEGTGEIGRPAEPTKRRANNAITSGENPTLT